MNYTANPMLQKLVSNLGRYVPMQEAHPGTREIQVVAKERGPQTIEQDTKAIIEEARKRVPVTPISPVWPLPHILAVANCWEKEATIDLTLADPTITLCS